MKTTYSVPVPNVSQGVIAKHLGTIEDFFTYKDFINEGWLAITCPRAGRVDLPWEDFMKVTLGVVAGSESDGTLIVFTSKNDKPLGYMILVSMGDEGHDLCIYAGYSNGKFVGSTEVAMKYVEDWARAHRFMTLQARTGRLNGAAMRLFKKKLGFRPYAVIFSKEL